MASRCAAGNTYGGWWRERESNPRPPAYEAGVLPLNYPAMVVPRAGVEPATFWLRASYSAGLSYRGMMVAGTGNRTLQFLGYEPSVRPLHFPAIEKPRRSRRGLISCYLVEAVRIELTSLAVVQRMSTCVSARFVGYRIQARAARHTYGTLTLTRVALSPGQLSFQQSVSEGPETRRTANLGRNGEGSRNDIPSHEDRELHDLALGLGLAS